MAIFKWNKEGGINSNKAIISLFRQGLKKNVKNKLIYDRAVINNFVILIKRVIAIDDKFYF